MDKLAVRTKVKFSFKLPAFCNLVLVETLLQSIGLSSNRQ